MLDFCGGLWYWLLSLLPDKALAVWLFEKPKADDNDLTFLCCIFTLNIGLSLVDDLRNSLARRLREIASGDFAKARTESWMRKLSRMDGRRYKEKKRHLQDVVKAALSCNDKVPTMFVRSGDWFKWAMVFAAGVSLWCMTVPNTCRITIVLALPFFLYLFWCVGEFGWFCHCRKVQYAIVDKEFEKIENQAADLDEGESLKDLLSKLNANIEALNQRFPGISEGLGTVDQETFDEAGKPKLRRKPNKKRTV